MPLLLLLLIAGCSQIGPKFRPVLPIRSAASLSALPNSLARIEVSLEHEDLFASGMDSTYLKVKLFDAVDGQLKHIDPAELNLSSSEDIEAKPFINKHGLYRAEILPRLRSPLISLRVDWQGRIFSREIQLKTTTAPLKEALEPMLRNYQESRSNGVISTFRGIKTPDTHTEGFYFRNLGDNRIVNIRKNPQAGRTFQFEYLEQARQNLAMQVDDSPNSSISHTMHSIFMFFPRKNLPLIEPLENVLEVTLPTGEKVIFQKESKEIIGGVFKEGPLDISENRFQRHYADLKYRGRGVVLRVNARGQSPKLGQYETNRIDLEDGLRGSVDVLISNGSTGQKCRRPKSDFWEPLDVSPVEFKFPTDDEFDRYLRIYCGFGLPRF